MQALEHIIFDALRGEASLISILGDPNSVHMHLAPDSQPTPMLTVEVFSDSMDAIPGGYEARAMVRINTIGSYDQAGQDALAAMATAQWVMENRLAMYSADVSIFDIEQTQASTSKKDPARKQIIYTTQYHVGFSQTR